MKTTTGNQKLPYAISEYVIDRFREDFLFDLKERKQVGDRWHYTIEVSKDDVVYTFEFDDKGSLLKEESEPAFPADAHDGPIPEEIPE
ncbi:MAG: hypothetical protein JNL40_06985 [Cyclobacteriaceae bacterium]|nr:hypothetical protein [Cyclobacteriaceae bacterium]